MNKKVYYRFELETQSALSIGASDSIATDADVVLDGRGKPIIPASSLAGVLRHAIEDPRVQTELFGSIDGDSARESLVKIYDAELTDSANISFRDNVALEKDEKIAAKGAKFDRQVVDRGACFLGYVEIDGNAFNFDAEALMEGLLEQLGTGDLQLGSKTTRGFGQVAFKDNCYKKMIFRPSDVESWLEFDMFNSDCWQHAECLIPIPRQHDEAIIDLSLIVNGAISIREYTTELPSEIDGLDSAPDYRQLTLAATGEPLIPGSSWAGAFRARIRQIEGNPEHENDLFGTVGKTVAKSRISFSESIVSGGEWKQITRNAIDRFTGGTIKSALFTELTHYNGTTALQIRIKRPCLEDFPALISAIADLNNGFLAVGGLTAVGHGLFRVNAARLTIEGKSIDSFAAAFVGKKLVCPDISAILNEIEPHLFPSREGE